MALAIIDTNLVIRLVTYDVPELAHQAEAMIDPMDDKMIELPLYVLAEVVYVLAYNRHYQYSRDRINKSLHHIINIPQFRLNHSIARQALNVFAHTKLDFVDCLLLAERNHAGQNLLTFDKELLKEAAKYQ